MVTRKEIADALKVAAANLFFKSRYSCTYELGLESWGAIRADVVAVKLSGHIVIVEVKSSVADFKADNKFKRYLKYCDRFYFCFTPDTWNKIQAKEELISRVPKRAGVILLLNSGYARIVRPCKIKEMNTDNRLAILARLAWRSGDLSKRVRRQRVRVYLPK